MALLLVVATTTGCGRGGSDSSSSDARVPPVTDETLERQFDLQVRGAFQAAVSQKLKVRFVLRPGKGESLSFSIASVTLPTPFQLAEGRLLSPEVAVAGMYEGDGDYTLPRGIGPVPTTGSTVKDESGGTTVRVSVAQVTLLDASATPNERRYGYLLEPCKVTLGDRARTGKADCPALVSHDGQQVAMTMSWGS